MESARSVETSEEQLEVYRIEYPASQDSNLLNQVDLSVQTPELLLDGHDPALMSHLAQMSTPRVRQ